MVNVASSKINTGLLNYHEKDIRNDENKSISLNLLSIALLLKNSVIYSVSCFVQVQVSTGHTLVLYPCPA